MINVRGRNALAVGAVVLSLPALLATLLVPSMVFLIARLSGANESPLGALRVLARASVHSWVAAGAIAAMVASVIYWLLFARIVIAFARGRAVSRAIQAYCVALVVLAVAERIHQQLQVGKLVVWFGSFSLLHVAALFALLILGKGWLSAGKGQVALAA